MVRRVCENAHQLVFGCISSIIALFAPAVHIIITVLCFIAADTYYGYKVSRKYGRKEIESKKIWSLVHKIRDVLIVITLALLVDKHLMSTYEALSSVRIAAGAICAAEAISLLESFRALHPNALLSKILSKIIKSKAEKYLEVDLSDVIDLKTQK